MLAAQLEVLFTYPTPTGDYDKIGRPSLHDRVGRLTRTISSGVQSLQGCSAAPSSVRARHTISAFEPRILFRTPLTNFG